MSTATPIISGTMVRKLAKAPSSLHYGIGHNPERIVDPQGDVGWNQYLWEAGKQADTEACSAVQR